MQFRRSLVLFALASMMSLDSGGAEPQAPDSETASKAIDGLIEKRMSDGGLAGVGAAIIINGKVAWTKGYGFADRELGIPFTPDTVMNIGSISKTFVGVALMRAAEEGKLSLDEDIDRYLPFRVTNPSFPDDRITLRQLATHTSSISDRWAVYERTYHYGGDSPEPLGSFLRDYFTSSGKYYSKDNFVSARPGTHRAYSNLGAALAALVLENVTGEALNVYTKQRIFAPLKMRSTGWFLSEIDPARHAKLYVSQGGMIIPIPLYGGTTWPDGGVRTSVADLSRFFIALLGDGSHEGGRVLEKSSVEEMLRFHYTDANRPDNVKLDEKNSGIFWQTKFNCSRIGHGGSDPGLKTEMLADRSKKIGVILFTNTSNCDEDSGAFVSLFGDLWSYAVALEATKTAAPEK